jgi:hypothetical protein
MRLILAAALAIAAPAAAQDGPAGAVEEEIVVTGQAVEEQVRGLVEAFTRVPGKRQLSRFDSSVCPAGVGLDAAAAGAVSYRMRQVARKAKIRTGKETCIPNVLVMITQDKKVLLEVLRRKYPQYLGEMSKGEVRRLADASGPAAAWQVEGPPLILSALRSSRITGATQRQWIGAVVIVEKDALIGLSTTQLADYAAMRAFAAADPANLLPSAPASILSLFTATAAGAVPRTLTKWDRAFLKGFYAFPAGLYAAPQRSAIRKEMQKELQSTSEEESPGAPGTPPA